MYKKYLHSYLPILFICLLPLFFYYNKKDHPHNNPQSTREWTTNQIADIPTNDPRYLTPTNKYSVREISCDGELQIVRFISNNGKYILAYPSDNNQTYESFSSDYGLSWQPISNPSPSITTNNILDNLDDYDDLDNLIPSNLPEPTKNNQNNSFVEEPPQDTNSIIKIYLGIKKDGRNSNWAYVRQRHLKRQPNCQWCYKTNSLIVHHIKPFHLYPELELVDANLVTLCNPCHITFGHLGNFRLGYNSLIAQDCLSHKKNKYFIPPELRPFNPVCLHPTTHKSVTASPQSQLHNHIPIDNTYKINCVKMYHHTNNSIKAYSLFSAPSNNYNKILLPLSSPPVNKKYHYVRPENVNHSPPF
jgi:hypothetical protein